MSNQTLSLISLFSISFFVMILSFLDAPNLLFNGRYNISHNREKYQFDLMLNFSPFSD